MRGLKTAQWAVSSGITLFDIQSFSFTYKLLFKRQFVKERKTDDICRLKFGTERVKSTFISIFIHYCLVYVSILLFTFLLQFYVGFPTWRNIVMSRARHLYSEPSLQRQDLFPKTLSLKWICCYTEYLMSRLICKKVLVLFLFPHRTFV